MSDQAFEMHQPPNTAELDRPTNRPLFPHVRFGALRFAQHLRACSLDTEYTSF